MAFSVAAEDEPACADGYDTPAQQREDSTTFMVAKVSRASGVKLVLCGHGKGHRDLSAEHSMRITVGYSDPARYQARKL